MNRYYLIIAVSIVCITGCNPMTRSTKAGGGTNAVVTKPLGDVALTDTVDGRVVSLWVIGRSGERVSLTELKKYPDLEKLTLQECAWLTDADLECLSPLARLKTLVLIRVPVSDEGLSHLASLPSLEEIQLTHTDVVGHGLRHLKGSALRRLEIHGPATTNEGLDSLSDLRSLRDVVIRCPNVELPRFTAVAELTLLESLDVRLCQGLDESLISRLEPLRHLNSFFFTSKGFTDQQLKKLCKLTALEEIDLDGAAVSNEGLNDLANLPNLRTLRLTGCAAVTDAGLARLSTAERLEALFLTHARVVGTGLADLAGHPTIRHVSIFSGQLSRAGRDTITELSETHPELDIFIESQ